MSSTAERNTQAFLLDAFPREFYHHRSLKKFENVGRPLPVSHGYYMPGNNVAYWHKEGMYQEMTEVR
jgi:hypothetical protein